MRLPLWTILGLAILAGPAPAAVVTSTGTGGSWSAGSTWVGGIAPAPGDDVVIAGPVQVDVSSACHDLTVLPAGDLHNGPTSLITLTVGGAVADQGTIRDNIFAFTLEAAGDISIDGVWSHNNTVLTGTAARQLSMGPGTMIEGNVVFAAGAGADIQALTPVSVSGNFDVDGGRLILGPECTFTIANGFFAGRMDANGNVMRFNGTQAFLWDCVIDDVVLEGTAQAISTDVFFTGTLTVQGIFQNFSSVGFASVRVHGNLLNRGEIRNATTSFLGILLSGDLTNDGILRNSQIAFGSSPSPSNHHLRMGPGAVCETPMFLPEIVVDTLFVDTPVETSAQIGLGIGTLFLGPGCDIAFTGFANLWGGLLVPGNVAANGNEVRMVGPGCTTLGLDYDAARIGGYFTIGGTTRFVSEVTVVDTLVNRAFNTVTAEFEGLLVNDNLITEDGGAFTMKVRGDVDNRGTWNNSLVRVEGVADQTIGIGPGIDVTQFVLASNLATGPFQWTRDGVPLFAQTAAELTLPGAHAGDEGVYRCEGAGGQMSRAITIAPNAATAAPELLPAGGERIVLAPNRPNPFRDATEIRFQLGAPERVALTVHDAAGRLVRTLVPGETLPAGWHGRAWDGRDDSGRVAASGVYFYRLDADGEHATRKLIRLR